jgi:DNA-binding NarL/FixJ family response regulator
LANARVAVEHARQAADPQVVNGVSFELAQMYASLGRHKEARALAVEGLALAEAAGDFWCTESYRAALGLVAIAEDEPQAAVEVLEPAWALMRKRGLGDLSIFPVAQVLGEALVALGCLDEALAVAGELRTSPVGGRPWARAMALRCEALVASARGDHLEARQTMAAALEAHGALPEPFEHARALQLAGRIERSARKWGAARAALIEALDRFDALGAARWAEKTAADLARLPGRRPTDGHALTTREREVAELVASGRANKEVAARLFVSVRTVEATLSKVYAKLGVRSRTELAGRLNRPW